MVNKKSDKLTKLLCVSHMILLNGHLCSAQTEVISLTQKRAVAALVKLL